MSPRRKINDCFYYFNGYCYKGDSCPFRHEPRALMTTVVCKRWRRRRCYNPHCPRRHAEHKRGPQYWEERTGRTPFLKSRYTLCQPSKEDTERWIRRVFLVFDAHAIEQANRRTFEMVTGSPYSPISGYQDWSCGPTEQPMRRKDIRIMLERVRDPIDRTISYSPYCHTSNETSYESPVEIKHEKSPTQRYGVAYESENDVEQRDKLQLGRYSGVSNASGCNWNMKRGMTMVTSKTEQCMSPDLAEGTAMERNSTGASERSINFNITSKYEFRDENNTALPSKSHVYETQIKKCTVETKCAGNSVNPPESKTFLQLFCSSPQKSMVRLQRRTFPTEEIDSSVMPRRKSRTWKLTNLSTSDDLEETRQALIRPVVRPMPFSSLSDSALYSRAQHNLPGISVILDDTPTSLGYYTRSRARAERLVGSSLEYDEKK